MSIPDKTPIIFGSKMLILSSFFNSQRQIITIIMQVVYEFSAQNIHSNTDKWSASVGNNPK